MAMRRRGPAAQVARPGNAGPAAPGGALMPKMCAAANAGRCPARRPACRPDDAGRQMCRWWRLARTCWRPVTQIRPDRWPGNSNGPQCVPEVRCANAQSVLVARCGDGRWQSVASRRPERARPSTDGQVASKEVDCSGCECGGD